MLNNKINSSSVKTQENQPEGSLDLNKMIQDPSNAELIDNSQAQQNKLFGLLKQSIKDFSMLPAEKQILAVSVAGGLLATALPLLLAAVPLAATGAMIGLALFFSVKAVQFGYKGLKWSAEKTVDGAKHIGGKIKDGAVHAKDSVKEGYEHSVDSLKRGTHLVNKRAKEKVSNVLTATADKLYRAAGNENYSDRIDNELIPDSRQKKKVQGIKEDFRAIFANGEDNSTLIKSILSGISSKIAEKIAGETYLDFRDYLPNQEVDRWKEQKRFVDNLDATSLHDLITKRMLDKSKYFRDSIFSEHYDEIKGVIAKCKEDHILKGSLKMRNNMFEEGSARPSRSSSFSSVFSLGRKDSTQSTSSLSKSSSLDSVRTESTASSEAELLNPAEHKEVKQSSGFFSRFKRNEPLKEATDIKYQAFSEPDTSPRQAGESTVYVHTSVSTENTDKTATIGRRPSSKQPIPAAPPKVPGSPSIDSGMGSGSSTPERYNPSIEESLKELDKTPEQLNSDISQLPSAKVGESSIHHPAGMKMQQKK